MRVLTRLAPHPEIIRDGIGIVGAGLIAYGSWLLLPAAGYIVGGMLIVVAAWLHARFS